MESITKTPRKRVANFTADEKALLAQLIKRKPIIESKFTDGKSVLKKKGAWDSITEEFNCNINVIKRDTITLKRAWENMKAVTRKARASERGQLMMTGGGPCTSPHVPNQEAIINMVEEAAPNLICEIKNTFDSDGATLNIIKEKEEVRDLEEINSIIDLSCFDQNNPDKDDDGISESPKNIDITIQNNVTPQKYLRKPADYIRREAVLRIKHLEAKKKIEMQILKTRLETEERKRRAAELEEETSKILLEKALLELKYIKLQLGINEK